MWKFSLITNTILLSKKKSLTPEEKERRQRQLEYEAQEWQKAKAYNRSWKGFLHRMMHWVCDTFLAVMLVELLGTTSPDLLEPNSLITLILSAYRGLIYIAYSLFDFQPRKLFLYAFLWFFIAEIPRQIMYSLERHKLTK